MPEDYKDSALRLFDEAGYLFDEGCYVTAEHLFGLAAECSVKQKLLDLGIPKDQVGQDHAFSGHLPHVLNTVANAKLTHPGRYAVLATFATNIATLKSEFIGFSMRRRYVHRDAVKAEDVTKFKDAVVRLRKVCDTATGQGKLRSS